MDSHTIFCCLRHLLKTVKRVYVIAQNELGLIKWDKYPIAIVQNNQPRSKRGEHFFCYYVYIENNKIKVDYFDSYGKPLSLYGIEFPLPIKHRNTNVLQPSDSDTCGLYCIYVLTMRSRGYSLDEIIYKFSNNLKTNDELVRRYYKSIKLVHMRRSYAQKCCPRKKSLLY